MKNKSASQSAFFYIRTSIGLLLVVAGVLVALIGLGTFSGLTASSAEAQQKYKIIDVPGLPPGFDCAQIRTLGIDRQENLRAGLIMIAFGESPGGSASSDGIVSQIIQNLLPSPLAYGGSDVDLVTGTETFSDVPSRRRTPGPTRITPTRSSSPTTIPQPPPIITPAH